MSRLTKILAAVSFLTSIPVNDERAHTAEALLEAPPYFPFAGFVVGLTSAACYTIALVAFGPGVAAAVALFAMVLLTRGLHLDGYVDTAEGFSAGVGRDEMARIMKDAHIGVFGAAALFFLLILKMEFLRLALSGFAVHFLVAVPIMARAALLPVMNSVPPASQVGLSARVSITRNKMLASCTLSLVAIFFLAGPQGVGAFLISLFVASAIGRYSRLRLGGITGDVYGFIVELVELIAFAVLAL